MSIPKGHEPRTLPSAMTPAEPVTTGRIDRQAMENELEYHAEAGPKMPKTFEERGEQAFSGVMERITDRDNELGFQDQTDECLLAAADAGLPVKMYTEAIYEPLIPIKWQAGGLRP